MRWILPDSITGKDYPIDYNTPAQIPGMVSNAIRAGATEDKSGVGRFLYNSTASIADSLIPMVAAPGFGQYLLGMSSAADTIHAAAERGATHTEALLLGAIAGAAEVVTEKMQFDRIFGAKNAGDLVKPFERILLNAVPEGMEEGATTLATTVADLLITKDKSELATMVRKYEDMGYGKERAQTMALRDWGKGLGADVVGGMFSGAVLTGGVELYNKASTNIQKAQVPKANQTKQQHLDRLFLQGFETAYGEDGTAQSKTDAQMLSDAYNAYHFDRYKEVLKENAPQTLEEFSKIRYDNGETWKQLQRQFEIVERYETRGTVPVDQVVELDQVAYRNKTDAFDFTAFHGKTKDKIKALATGGNAAAMELDGKVYFSHSAAKTEGTFVFDSYVGKHPLIGLSEERLFTTQDLGDGIPREYDTEAKFLEYVAKMKRDTTEAFTVTILSEKHICESCEGVVEQFQKRYPNATVNIISGNPNYGEANARGERGLKTWKYRKD